VTKDHILQIFNTEKEEKEVKLKVFCDSEYDVDRETRRRVTGFLFVWMEVKSLGYQRAEKYDSFNHRG
jgi:hypothetical protein